MTNEKINIAIAEVCGWRAGGKGKEWGEQQTLGVPPNSSDGHWQHMPDYCDDLNAMHEAEKTLDYSMLCDMEDSVGFHFAIKPFHATARQRAEAFLRTLGRWEEAAK